MPEKSVAAAEFSDLPRLGEGGRFVDNGDGTVIDTATGLMWMRPALGQSWNGITTIGVPKKYGLEEAKKITHNFAGFQDWCLPTIDELSSIVNHAYHSPTININVFPNSPEGSFLSKTDFEEEYIGKSVWEVNFINGEIVHGNIFLGGFVRLVRKEQKNSPVLKEGVSDNGDGTITDQSTGLTWMCCAIGQTWSGGFCSGEPGLYTWDEAKELCSDFAKNNSWRLPTLGELNTILNRSSKTLCSIPGTRSEEYWTSTQFFDDEGSGRTIDFSNGRTGHSYSKSKGCIVRLVSGSVSKGALFGEERCYTENGHGKSFSLNLSKFGSGEGDVLPFIDQNKLPGGEKIKIFAKASEGSVFMGWSGDISEANSTCVFVLDSDKSIIANFIKPSIPDLEISLSFDSAESANMKNGSDAFILYFSIANKGKKQVRVELPLASYITQHGEEFEQDVWLSGLINGLQGATIRAGTFRKVGLVFYKEKLKSITTGDQVQVLISQSNPAQRFSFTFRCTDQASRNFTLIDAKLEEVPGSETELVVTPLETAEVLAAPAEIAELRQRIALLESGLSEVQRELAALRAAPPTVFVTSQPEPALSESPPSQTLPQVLAWLATQQRVSVAALRNLLLPLDLLPSALIDEINERALDMLGEPALEDQDDEILVIQEVLAEILTDWDALTVSPDPDKE